jgi:sortase A
MMITIKMKIRDFMSFLKRNYIILLAALIIFVGIYVMLYPWFRAGQLDDLNQQALDHWRFMANLGEWDEDTEPDYDSSYLYSNMAGVLTIEKIDFQSVILAPASKRNLDIAVCSVIDSRVMGQEGNYVLAGHYSQIYGRHLNRIKEVKIGDIIKVENEFEEFGYRVTEVFSVPPSETWVMDNDDIVKQITIISCDYATSPHNRWIVRGEIEE